MRAFYAPIALWATLVLSHPLVLRPPLLVRAMRPEKTVPQGQDPPGADNGEEPPTSNTK